MRTWANTTPESEEHTARHPWKAPGSAPVFAACGVAGGNPLGCPVVCGMSRNQFKFHKYNKVDSQSCILSY